MRRWDTLTQKWVDSSKVDAFLSDVLAVCERHGMIIGHEDSHGSFQVGVYGESDKDALMAASIRDDLSRKGA